MLHERLVQTVISGVGAGITMSIAIVLVAVYYLATEDPYPTTTWIRVTRRVFHLTGVSSHAFLVTSVDVPKPQLVIGEFLIGYCFVMLILYYIINEINREENDVENDGINVNLEENDVLDGIEEGRKGGIHPVDG